MGTAIEQAAILADTSPFCRFAEADICELLVDYLAERLHLTAWVIAELEHRAKQPAHAQLQALEGREPPWVTNLPVQLDQDELKRADALAQGWRSLQESRSGQERDPCANLCETTTIIAAQRNGWAVLLDEGKARVYAEKRGLVVFSTQDVVVEMAAAGQIRVRRAYLVYRKVYTRGTQGGFDEAVVAATSALGV